MIILIIASQHATFCSLELENALIIFVAVFYIYFTKVLFLQKRLQQRPTTKENGTYRKEGTKPRPSKSDKPKACHSKLVLNKKKLEMKDGTDSQVNNPYKVKPKFARESTHWFPFLKMWETIKFMPIKSLLQLNHLVLSCHEESFENAITNSIDFDSNKKLIQFLL